MTAITNLLTGPTGTPVPGARVAATLVGAGFLATGDGEVIGTAVATTDVDGRWTMELTPTGDYAAGGAHYLIREHRHEWRITVPASGTHNLLDVLMTAVPAGELLVGLSRAEADELYAPIAHTHTPGQVGFLVLGPADPVPAETPAGTVIIRG